MRLLPSILLAALGGSLAVASGAPLPASAHAPLSVGRCYTGNLSLSSMGSTGGLGHIGIQLRFRNRSSRTCSLYGFPGAQLLNARHQPMPTHVTWGGGYLSGNLHKQLVILKPGASAYSIMEWSDVPSGNGPCPTSIYAKITPPNTYTAILFAFGSPTMICRGGLTMSPVQAKAESGFQK